MARFYRATGNGCYARINRLLGSYAHMKIAQEVQMDAMLEKRVTGES